LASASSRLGPPSYLTATFMGKAEGRHRKHAMIKGDRFPLFTGAVLDAWSVTAQDRPFGPIRARRRLVLPRF
jgi:hypothetical protein